MHEGFGCLDSSEQTVPQWENIAIFGASINRIGFGAYYTITIVRNPYNPILIIKAPILNYVRPSRRPGLFMGSYMGGSENLGYLTLGSLSYYLRYSIRVPEFLKLPHYSYP